MGIRTSENNLRVLSAQLISKPLGCSKCHTLYFYRKENTMSQNEFRVGDMVVLSTEEWQGVSAIVTKPIAKENIGHVLIHVDGNIIGVTVSADEIALADETTQGFAQLAYNLIKLGSHVIEKALI
jgi:hypothetical protein